MNLKIQIFENPREFLNKYKSNQNFRESIGVLLIDMMMDIPGDEVLKKVREFQATTNTKIVMFSAVGAIDSKVAQINSGANDYWDKTIDPELFVAKVKALWREVNELDAAKVAATPQRLTELNVQGVEIVIDRGVHDVVVNKAALALTEHEFILLEYLIDNPDVYHSARNIERIAFDNNYFYSSDSVRTHVSSVRKKLKLNGAGLEKSLLSKRYAGWGWFNDAH
jgi:two-component system copper resistance phosphate regulon response regulator CusR